MTTQRDSDIRQQLVESAIRDGYRDDQAERLADEAMGYTALALAQGQLIRSIFTGAPNGHR